MLQLFQVLSSRTCCWRVCSNKKDVMENDSATFTHPANL